VAERGKCSVGSIGEGLGITHPAVVKLVDKLTRKGLVRRGVAAADHRQSEISATEEGRQLVNRIRGERTQRLARVLDAMPAGDRQALIQGLEAFVTLALSDGGALDALCRSCQALLPTDCADFQIMMREGMAEHAPRGEAALSKV
jgi:DNA-binding MarR family transcriptional regulator